VKKRQEQDETGSEKKKRKEAEKIGRGAKKSMSGRIYMLLRVQGLPKTLIIQPQSHGKDSFAISWRGSRRFAATATGAESSHANSRHKKGFNSEIPGLEKNAAVALKREGNAFRGKGEGTQRANRPRETRPI